MRFLSLLFWLVSGILLLDSCAGTHATTHYGPRVFWRPNRYDRHGREQGRWRTYYDSANKQPFTAGRYRHGQPVRTFRYYAPTGALDHSEQYSRDGFCEVTYWYPNGQVARQGHAQWVTGSRGTPRFYWFGPWTSYAQDGQTTSLQTYTDGELSRTETYTNGQLTQIETFEKNKRARVETYADGQLIKVETFEKGLRTGATNTL
jgi:antitoxin component YwqK of YwqJK toxin-antitoxin module